MVNLDDSNEDAATPRALEGIVALNLRIFGAHPTVVTAMIRAQSLRSKFQESLRKMALMLLAMVPLMPEI